MTEENITKLIDAFVALLPYLTGALIGAFGGIVGTRYAHGLKTKGEANAIRRERLEELVTELKEIEVWFSNLREWRLNDGERVKEWSPAGRVESLVSLYFPEMEDELEDLTKGMAGYRTWLTKVRKAKERGAADASWQKIVDSEGNYYEPFIDTIVAVEDKAKEIMRSLMLG